MKWAFRFKASILLAVVFVLVGCAGGSGPTEPSDWRYTLDAGDEIKIVVFGDDRLSDNYRVGDSGNISLPLLGNVPVRGRTTEGLEKILVDRLSDGYLRDPNVRVEMVAYRPLYILGEVQSPGKYPYEPGMTALSAAAVAGGFTYRADTDSFKVTRKFADGRTQTGEIDAGDRVFPGDIIEVSERFF